MQHLTSQEGKRRDLSLEEWLIQLSMAGKKTVMVWIDVYNDCKEFRTGLLKKGVVEFDENHDHFVIIKIDDLVELAKKVTASGCYIDSNGHFRCKIVKRKEAYTSTWGYTDNYVFINDRTPYIESCKKTINRLEKALANSKRRLELLEKP